MTLWIAVAALGLLTPRAAAQHPHDSHPKQPVQPQHHGHDEHGASMRSSVNLLDPLHRESSGTAWQPESTPMYGRMQMRGNEMLMLHGALYPRYTHVGSPRGDDRVDAPSWFMAMYSRPLDTNSQLGLRAMLSLDPLIEGGFGYPLLFQSGETWGGRPLHDRQHPHDLFAELSASYSRRVGRDLSAYLYAGLPGEPALGPPAFMHRLSAMDNPDAPLGHHWQDSTHITFGVLTVGVSGRQLKLEGSAFNGREPDEDRYDIDRPRLNSYSGRLSWNPNPDTAMQVSHGFLKSPEALEPDLNLHRTTLSVLYNRPLPGDGNVTAALIWGENRDAELGATHSALVEGSLRRRADTVYGRIERVQKTGHDLALDAADEHRKFTINAFTLGYVRDLRYGAGAGMDVGIGGQATLNTKSAGLSRYYGGGNPVSFQVFLRIRPSRH